MGTAAEAARKKEKRPKEGKEDPKNEQNEKKGPIHTGCQFVVAADLLLLPAVQIPISRGREDTEKQV